MGPHPVVGTIRDDGDCIRVLVLFYYTTITGWGVHRRYNSLVAVYYTPLATTIIGLIQGK